MTLESPPWANGRHFRALADCLGAAKGRTRVIGGAVRDTLLGLRASDIDLATVYLPEETQRRIKAAGFRSVPTGIRHGTITAILPAGTVEVTTLRRDVETDGRHAQVAFTDDWQEDAARRDFTINALSVAPAGGRIHDYFGGVADLEARAVRFIGDPLQRIAEDHLRILRFFRFHARFAAGAPDAPALAACAERANDLMALSRERIAQELLKLLAVADPVPTVRIMVDRAILAPVLPEIEASGVERLAALVAIEPMPDPVRRLAALLPADPALAERVAARLKLSNAQRRRLALAADPAPAGDPRALAYRIGLEGTRDRLLLAGLPDALATLEDWTPPRLPLAGGALIARGLPPGPIVAATLAAVERRWVEEGFPEHDRLDAIADEEVASAGTIGPDA